MYHSGALGKLLHHTFLNFRRLGNLVVVDGCWRGEVELVGGFDVRRLFEQVHQLRQIVELGKARPRPVAGALRGKLDGGGGLSKGGGPAVEVSQVLAL